MTIEKILEGLGLVPYSAFVKEPCEVTGEQVYYSVKSGFILLFVPYRPISVKNPSIAFADAYYPAYQRAYGAKVKIKSRMAELGLYSSDFKGEYKRLFSLLGVGKITKNTLLSFPVVGTFCAIEVVATDENVAMPSGEVVLCEECRECDACVRLCPMGALTGKGLIRERCIRDFQCATLPPDKDREIKEKLSNKVMGCNICQIGCPRNIRLWKRADEPDREYESKFDLDTMALGCIVTGEVREVYNKYYGKNYMRPRRVLSHVLCAMENDAENIKRHYSKMREYKELVADTSMRALIEDYLKRWEEMYEIN